MPDFEGIFYGFKVSLVPARIFACLLGSVLGTFVGILPGLGPTATIALLLPVSFLVDPTSGLIMMAGIYYGAMYGGSTTSILVNIPGEAASVVTCVEGHLMAKRGRGGAALAVCAVGSFIAGTFGVLAVTIAAPALAGVALIFGPPEFMTLGIMGIIAVLPLLGGSIINNGFTAVLGLMLATVGIDQMTGNPRFTFGYVQLTQGINLTPLCMGLFGVTELMVMAEQATTAVQSYKTRFRELFPTLAEWRRAVPAIMRGTAIGLPIGLIPGSATILSSFIAFSIEKRISGPESNFGKGAIEGVASPESANNAAATTCLIPLLALGLPFGSATALMLGAMMMHGIAPGPLLITQHPELFWGVIASMYIGNVMLLVLNYPLVGFWASLLKLPKHVLAASIALFMLLGTYSVDTSVFDIGVAIFMGVIGYVFRKMNYDPVPLVLGFVLGSMIENSLRQTMIMLQGDIGQLIHRPVVILLVILGLLPMVIPLAYRLTRGSIKQSDNDQI